VGLKFPVSTGPALCLVNGGPRMANNRPKQEEIHSEIEPDFLKGIKGTHTYNFDTGLVVFDYIKVSKKASGT
jgi:hypothetical protein